jgi:hypothetical protein
VPEEEDETPADRTPVDLTATFNQIARQMQIDAAPSRHTEIQHHLLRLGVDMGLDVWVARNDRSRVWNGQVLGQMHGCWTRYRPSSTKRRTGR